MPIQSNQHIQLDGVKGVEMESKGGRWLLSACKKLIACLSVLEVIFHFISRVHVFQEAPTFPSFCAPVLPVPGGCAPFSAIMEGFADTQLHLPSLLSAEFRFTLAAVNQITKSARQDYAASQRFHSVDILSSLLL